MNREDKHAVHCINEALAAMPPMVLMNATILAALDNGVTVNEVLENVHATVQSTYRNAAPGKG